MKVTLSILLMSILGLSLFAGPVWAIDYSAKTTEELSAMRGTMRTAPPIEREAFIVEWQKRLQAMTPAELQKYSFRPKNALADGKGFRNNAPPDGKGLGRGAGRRR